MIYNQVVEDDIVIDEENMKKNKVQKKSIFRFAVIIAMALALSGISLSNNIYPIGYVMLGVASAFNVPLLIVATASLISMLLFGVSFDTILPYLFFFILFTLATAMLNIKGLSKKYGILIKMVICMTVVGLVQVIFMSYSFFSLLMHVFSVCSIYLIFAHGTSVIINIRKGYIFTQEEKISALAILAFILSIFADVSIMGVHISNIVAIMVVLIYGYRQGPVAGCVAGFVIGLIICLTSKVNISFLASIGTGGLIAGIMNKIGKPATVIGFIIGSCIAGYFSSNFAYYTTNIIEIVVAAIPVLVMPKKIARKIEAFFNINKCLEAEPSNLLTPSKEAKEKLNAISDVLTDISKSDNLLTKEDKLEFRNILKKYIMDYLKSVNIGTNHLEKIIDEEKLELSIDYIASKLEAGDEISEDMIMFECKDKDKMLANIKDVYDNVKVMKILRRKEMQLHEKCANEYKELSNIIVSVANDSYRQVPIASSKDIKGIREELKMLGYPIYEDELVTSNEYAEYTFITDILVDIDMQKQDIIKAVSSALGKNMTIRLLLNISKTEKSKIKLASVTEYTVDTSMSQISKDPSSVNGDSHLCMGFGKEKYISALSDGAGSGSLANESSKAVINTLEKLIKAGFDENKAFEIVNSVIKMRQDESHYASLDVAIFDLQSASASFIKFGAAPTYILSEGKITSINSMNIPVGIINDAEYIPIVKKLNNNDIVFQISDGALLKEGNIHDNYLTDILSKVNINMSSKNIADSVLNKIIEHSSSNIADDITVVVNKIMANKYYFK